MIKRKHWKHRGLPGHLCSVAACEFRLCTDIGKVRVSTVGAYYPNEGATMQLLGAARHYETMVFHIGSDGKINSYQELDMDGIKHPDGTDPYETDKLAEEMHERMCLKWAKAQSSRSFRRT